MITEQERKRRRMKYRLVQLALVMLSVGIVMAFWGAKRETRRDPDLKISVEAPAASDLAPGDIQIFNVDSTVDLVLRGPSIYAGLSPQTVEKIRARLREPSAGDPEGLGSIIATAVKEQVADKIEAHVRYDVRDIEDIRYDNERLVIESKSGKQQRLFETIKSDGKGDANRFRPEDAHRFIELVKARQEQLRTTGAARPVTIAPANRP
jgi:hypothetical protein